MAKAAPAKSREEITSFAHLTTKQAIQAVIDEKKEDLWELIAWNNDSGEPIRNIKLTRKEYDDMMERLAQRRNTTAATLKRKGDIAGAKSEAGFRIQWAWLEETAPDLYAFASNHCGSLDECCARAKALVESGEEHFPHDAMLQAVREVMQDEVRSGVAKEIVLDRKRFIGYYDRARELVKARLAGMSEPVPAQPPEHGHEPKPGAKDSLKSLLASLTKLAGATLDYKALSALTLHIATAIGSKEPEMMEQIMQGIHMPPPEQPAAA